MSAQTPTCRVRFAPSPTGHLHVGSLRSALFNWLFARHHGGTFLLRIEDTDVQRSKDDYTQALLEAFAWCGIESDEPIVVQSHRIAEYQEAAGKLVQSGQAYWCLCSKEEMALRVGPGAAEGGFAQYDSHCRFKKHQGQIGRDALRFAMPASHDALEFPDLIRGQMSYARNQFDDFIILRSDGMPTYNFSVVIDDAQMAITHIIRGEEHLINTPRQIELYKAFGWTIPHFAHIPLILGSDGSKLSKRDAATAVVDYMRAGFLPQALCNYLVRLGWSHGDQEIFTTEELIRYFDLANVGKKGSIFDMQKLLWVNSVYLKQQTPSEVLKLIERFIEQDIRALLPAWDEPQLLQAIALYQPRCSTAAELYSALKKLHDGSHTYQADELTAASASPSTRDLLRAAAAILAQETSWNVAQLSHGLKKLCITFNQPLSALGKPLRYALTGSYEAPGIFELLALLGQTSSMMRIEKFLTSLDGREEQKPE